MTDNDRIQKAFSQKLCAGYVSCQRINSKYARRPRHTKKIKWFEHANSTGRPMRPEDLIEEDLRLERKRRLRQKYPKVYN